MAVFGAKLLGDSGLGTIRVKVERAAAQAVSITEKDFRDYVASQMRAPKSGAYYTRPGRIHRASAPGEAPAIDFGRLLGSLRTRFADRGMTAEVSIGNDGNLAYASWLEDGHNGKRGTVAPRPYWAPAVEAVRPTFEANLRRRLNTISI